VDHSKLDISKMAWDNCVDSTKKTPHTEKKKNGKRHRTPPVGGWPENLSVMGFYFRSIIFRIVLCPPYSSPLYSSPPYSNPCSMLYVVAHLILSPPSLILDHGADCPEMVRITILPLHLYGELCLFRAINK
jgi:hypothetical protein